jgi:hypothetical protein
MPDAIDALAELPGTAQTFTIRRPIAKVAVELPNRPGAAAIFADAGFEDWWTMGLCAAIRSRDLTRAEKVASVQLLLDLAIVNGLA